MDEIEGLVEEREGLVAAANDSGSPLGYEGSDEDIRAKFEQYLYGLLSCSYSSRRSMEGGERGRGGCGLRLFRYFSPQCDSLDSRARTFE